MYVNVCGVVILIDRTTVICFAALRLMFQRRLIRKVTDASPFVTGHCKCRLTLFLSYISDEARAKKSGVLVHCLAGVSRSVTVTVAYLMSSMSLSLNDAYDYVKRCKPNISPNFNFMGQLLDFEKTLNQGSMVCTCCSSSSESGSASSSASSTGEELKCQCTQSFFTSPVNTPPMFKSNTEVSATPS